MIAAGMNDQAMRFGGFRFGHGGEGFALLLMGIVVFALLIWALAEPRGNQSAKG